MQQQKMDVVLFRRTPPKIRPLMIVLTALSLGLLFLGLTLTIVGNWPGYSPYGGNPLKIVGPILLALGILTLIAITVDCCIRANKPHDDYEKKFADIDTSKGSIDPSGGYPSTKGSKPGSSASGQIDGTDKVIPLPEPPRLTGSGHPGAYQGYPQNTGQAPGQHPYAAKYNNQRYPGPGGYDQGQHVPGGIRPNEPVRYETGISPGTGSRDPWQTQNGYPQQPNNQAPVYTRPNQSGNPQLGHGGAFKPIQKPTGSDNTNQQPPGRPISGPKLDSSADSSAPRKLTWGASKNNKKDPKDKDKDNNEGKRTPVMQMPLAVKPDEGGYDTKSGRPEDKKWGQQKQNGTRNGPQEGQRGTNKPHDAQKPYNAQKPHDTHDRSRDPHDRSHDTHDRSHDSHQKRPDPQRSRDQHQRPHDPHGSHRSKSRDRPGDARKRGSVNEAFEQDVESPTESTPKEVGGVVAGNERRDRREGGRGSQRGDPRRSRSAGRDPHDRDHHRDPIRHRGPHHSQRSRSSDRHPHRRDKEARYRDLDRSMDSSNSRLEEVQSVVAIDYTSGKPVDRKHPRGGDSSRHRGHSRERSRDRDRDRERDRRHAHSNPAYDHESDHRKTSPEHPSSSDLSSRHRGHRSREPYDEARGRPGTEGVPYKTQRRKPQDLNTSDNATSMEDLLSNVSTKNTTVVNPSLTINVNAQAGSAVQIALGNQSMPTNPLAKSMIEYSPNKTAALPAGDTDV